MRRLLAPLMALALLTLGSSLVATAGYPWEEQRSYVGFDGLRCHITWYTVQVYQGGACFDIPWLVRKVEIRLQDDAFPTVGGVYAFYIPGGDQVEADVPFCGAAQAPVPFKGARVHVMVLDPAQGSVACGGAPAGASSGTILVRST